MYTGGVAVTLYVGQVRGQEFDTNPAGQKWEQKNGDSPQSLQDAFGSHWFPIILT